MLKLIKYLIENNKIKISHNFIISLLKSLALKEYFFGLKSLNNGTPQGMQLIFFSFFYVIWKIYAKNNDIYRTMMHTIYNFQIFCMFHALKYLEDVFKYNLI